MALTTGFVASAAVLGLNSIMVKPKRAIGPFEAQVTIRESHTDSLQITAHPVEQGAEISDHAYALPAELTVECAWSNSPSTQSLIGGLLSAPAQTLAGATGLVTGNTKSQVQEVYEKLRQLQASRVPFDVYTGKRLYKNMLIKTLTTNSTKETENSLIVVAEMREVNIVNTQTVVVSAPASRQANPSATAPVQNLGTQSLQPGSAYVPTAGAGRGLVNPPLVTP